MRKPQKPHLGTRFALVLSVIATLCACDNSATTGASPSASPQENKPSGPSFEVVVLDDKPDPFATLPEPVPKGISQFQEGVIFSPEDIQTRTYVRLVIQPGETLPQAMSRAKPWFEKFQLPAGDRLLFSEIVEDNEITKTREPVGVRTYVGTSQTVLTQTDVESAEVGAQPDQKNKPQPVAIVQLTPIAARKFQQFTKENMLRRIAVMSSGNVLMAPLIQDEIAGGKLTIGLDPEMEYAPKRAELERFVSAIRPKTAAPSVPK